MRLIEFEVIDNNTGREPNCELIAKTEDWANNLMPYDIDSFAMTEEGRVVLIYDCGNCAFAPSDRFTVKFDNESLRPKGRWIEHEWAEEENGLLVSNFECSNCHIWESKTSDYCPNCGAKMEG